MKIAFVILLIVAGASGQQPGRELGQVEFGKVYWSGLETTFKLGEKGLRYTETRVEHVLTIESDKNRSIRVSYRSLRSPELDSEAIIIGDALYERTGIGGWSSPRSLAEHTAVEARRLEALQKAAKGTPIYDSLRRGRPAEATWIAVRPPKYERLGPLGGCTDPNAKNVTVRSLGNAVLNGSAARTYNCSYTVRPTVGPNTTAISAEIEYWFHETSGAFLKATTRHNSVDPRRPGIFVNSWEWQLDPTLVIAAPKI